MELTCTDFLLVLDNFHVIPFTYTYNYPLRYIWLFPFKDEALGFREIKQARVTHYDMRLAEVISDRGTAGLKIAYALF